MEQDVPSEAIAFLHGACWRMADIADQLANCLRSSWECKQWHPQPALVEPGGVIIQFLGQVYDPSKAALVSDAWDHDHCEICLWELHETDDPEHGIGYTDGQNWVCTECYARFLAPEAKQSMG